LKFDLTKAKWGEQFHRDCGSFSMAV
jgi:hypothetical protein